jgi:hypothetical protein
MCPGGATACGLSCVDLTSDARNCGTCGHVCQARSTCTASACACDTGLSDCSGVCVDEQTDLTNCGGCGINCGVGGACSAGTCTCATGFDMCDGVSCTNTQNDRNNCGTCGHLCAAGEVCLMGGCTSSPPTHYRWRTTTVAEAPWIDACAASGSLMVLPGYDDGDILEPLPFAFRYWATDLPAGSMINLSTNGYIGMNGILSSSYSGTLPSTVTPNAVVAAHWGDLETRTTGMCVDTIGAAPDRQWVVEWNDAEYLADPTAHLTFEIVLAESGATIDVIFNTTTNAISRYTGIEDQTGGMSLGGCAAGAYMCVPTAATRIRFEPIP